MNLIYIQAIQRWWRVWNRCAIWIFRIRSQLDLNIFMTILGKLQSIPKHRLSPGASWRSTVWYFFPRKKMYKSGYCFPNLLFQEILFLSFLLLSSFSSSLRSRAIVLRYDLEHYLVQSPRGGSWVWKDSTTSVLWNGIIRTISRRNPFRCVYSLFHHEPNFILFPTSLSVSFWGSAAHVIFVQSHDFLLRTPARCQQHWKKMTTKIKFYCWFILLV